MNDSLLEELGLRPEEEGTGSTPHIDKYVTRRRRRTVKAKTLDKMDKVASPKSKQMERKVQVECKQQGDKKTVDSKLHESKMKQAAIKDRNCQSSSYKETARLSDASSKENSSPTDASKDSSSANDATKQTEKETKESDCIHKDPVAFLNAIKELISSYTKQETQKILRSVYKLHYSSQANLIKSFVVQTDELIDEMHSCKDRTAIGALVQENERLRDDIRILRLRNEELQKKMEEFHIIKEENLALKKQCKELSGSSEIQNKQTE